MSLFCKHKWKFLKTHTLRSQAAEAQECGLSITQGNPTMLYLKSVSTYTCPKCGDFKEVCLDNQ